MSQSNAVGVPTEKFGGGLPIFNMTVEQIEQVADPVQLMSQAQWTAFANSFIPALARDWRDGYLTDPLAVISVLKKAALGCDDLTRWTMIGFLMDRLEEKGRSTKVGGCQIIPRWMKNAASELDTLVHLSNPTLARSSNASDSTVKRVIAILTLLKLNRDLGGNKLKTDTVYKFIKEHRELQAEEELQVEAARHTKNKLSKM